MDKLLEALTSPVWWVSVVIAGVVVNLVAAYLKPRLDGFLSATSSRWRTTSAAARERREQFLTQLQSDPAEFHYQQMRELRLRAQATFALLLGVFFLLFTVNLLPGGNELLRIPFLLISALIFMFSAFVFGEAATLCSQLGEARTSMQNGQQSPAPYPGC